MLKDCEWSEDRYYKTGSPNEPAQFYLEGLANSTKFDLLLGYFSSAAINLLSLGFAKFISKGGKMRMVINHLLSESDKLAFENSKKNNYQGKVFDLNDIISLSNVLGEYDKHFFECLSYLISDNRIDIKIIKPKDSSGISHYKSGVFSDGINQVGYSASCNFTLFGLSENLEGLNAFFSWENGRSNIFIRTQLKLIDEYFSETDETVEYLPVNKIEVVLKDKFGGKDINELLIQEDKLLKKKSSLIENPNFKKAITKLFAEIEEVKYLPKFPFTEGPRQYQKIAFENWLGNNYQGMFAMATGTGKTITSLNCLLEIYKKTGYYKALILVPTISLVEQWVNECTKFNFTENLVKVYSLTDWQADLSRLETMKLLNKEFSYVVIATYSSFLSKKFQDRLKEMTSDTLLIADECHNMGSNNLIKSLKTFHLKKRIGLSATPERQFQDEVNMKIREFFSEKNENDYTFSYTMQDAIKKEPRALCPYRYYPKIVRLTDSEFKSYVAYTKRILSFHPKNDEEREIFNRLCIARQRIIHKAENKLDVFKTILMNEYSKRKNLKYTLVYVPEGLADEDASFDSSKSDILKETDSDLNLLNLYTKIIGEISDDVSVKQFIGSTNSDDRKNILSDFANGNLQVITSMKCLDEGIDVPRSELAIFCASTGNPRQFIQRRGRVLRLAKGKDEAIIYDLVVVPEPSGEISLFKVEQGEIEKELRRVRDFAEMSENKHYTRQVLDPLLKHYQLTL